MRMLTIAVAMVVAAATLSATVGAQTVGAQTAGDTSGPDETTTSVPGASSTTAPTTIQPGSTTTTPGRTTTTRPGGTARTSTTTVVDPPLPHPTIPPELAADPRAPILFDPGPGDGGDAPVFQPDFSSVTNEVLQGKVDELTARLVDEQSLLGEHRAELLELERQIADLRGELSGLDRVSRANVAAAAEVEAELRDHTVDAFVNGSSDDRIAMVRTSDPVQIGVARELLDSVVESDAVLLERHERAQARLDEHEADLVADLTKVRIRQSELNEAFIELLGTILEDAQALKAYENGAQVYVRGFVFPVRGEVEFIDSWGYPRMTGTASAHWHQGTDIFARMGTPLVASESGVLDRVGTAGLGGMRLWVKGDSGNDYYYAHLSAFAPGMKDGLRVNAGDVVGFVGDTGNAKGTSPHLHFEIHPGGGDAVNPYPLLAAIYGSKPMVEIVEPPAPGAVAGTGGLGLAAPPAPGAATPGPSTPAATTPGGG